MTSPSVRKAAGKICKLTKHPPWGDSHEPAVASIIQQAITEAVDAAVSAERAFWQKRIAELQSNGMEEK